MATNKLMVVDTETGGLSSDEQSILSFGAVILAGNNIIDSMEIFIAEPEIIAEPEALRINKIDIDWLRKNGLPPKEAVITIIEFIHKHFTRKGKAHLAGQNVHFDVGFMQRIWKLVFGKDWRTAWEIDFHHRTHDTMHVLRFLGAAGALPFEGGSLDSAADFLDIDRSVFKRHSAKDDAALTAKVLVGLTNYVSELHDKAWKYDSLSK